MQLSWNTATLEFIKPARTSRGAYTTRKLLLLELRQGNCAGTGEASPLPDLSIDGEKDPTPLLHNLQEWLLQDPPLEEILNFCTPFPAIQFALEAAWMQLKSRRTILFDTAFTRGECGIPINGLVWMDDTALMEQEALKKAGDGFRCIKFKVGALDHDAECRMLEHFRRHYNAFQTEIRLDANGAFGPDIVAEALRDFAKFGVHSIEQPVKPGFPELMQEICAKSPVPVALDEELIGIPAHQAAGLLKNIKPAYIILKPTLIGGFTACDHWIRESEKLSCGWWATSALESNIALSHIAQWVSSKKNPLHQGLGTGSLFKNNYPSPLYLQGEEMWFNASAVSRT